MEKFFPLGVLGVKTGSREELPSFKGCYVIKHNAQNSKGP